MGLSWSRLVCALPKIGQFTTAEEKGSKGVRITLFVAAVILLVTGILALRKVGSFARLGEKFGWSGVATGIALLLGIFSIKYVKAPKQSENGKSKLVQLEPIPVAHPVKPEKPIAPVKPKKEGMHSAASPSICFETTPQTFQIDSDIKIADCALFDRTIAISTKSATTIRSWDNALLHTVAPNNQVTVLAKEGNKLVFYNYTINKIVIASIEEEEQKIEVLLELDKDDWTKPRVSIDGDTIAILVSNIEVQFYSWSQKEIMSSFTIEDDKEINDLKIKEDRILIKYFCRINNVLESTLLVHNIQSGVVIGEPIFTIERKSGYIEIIDTKKFLYIEREQQENGSDKEQSVICSAETGQVIATIPDCEDRLFKTIFYKNISISLITKSNGNSSIMTSDPNGKILQAWKIEGQKEIVDITMVGNELVVCGHERTDDYGCGKNITIWKYSLKQ